MNENGEFLIIHYNLYYSQEIFVPYDFIYIYIYMCVYQFLKYNKFTVYFFN